MKAIVTVGISASGKSTFAREWVEKKENRVDINRDTTRRQLVEADGKVWCWANWKWKRENEVSSIANAMIKEASDAGHDIIISDTNLNKGRRDALVKKLEDLGYQVEIKDFPITWEEAVKRDDARANGVGQSVLATQFEQWNEYIGRKKYVYGEPLYHETNTDKPIDFPKSKPKCILVDIDGTLAHMNGKRGAFEWDKVGLDDVDEMVREIVNRTRIDWEVIILSGRDGVCRPETDQWLKDNSIRHDMLLMREAGDMRKDTVVKEEIFWCYIANNYDVQFVIDDRPCVVRLWQEIGLKTFAVGNQHIEF